MGNPMCPKCGSVMKQKWQGTEPSMGRTGRAKFWVCNSKKCEVLHGKQKFRVGGQVIM